MGLKRRWQRKFGYGSERQPGDQWNEEFQRWLPSELSVDRAGVAITNALTNALTNAKQPRSGTCAP